MRHRFSLLLACLAAGALLSCGDEAVVGPSTTVATLYVEVDPQGPWRAVKQILRGIDEQEEPPDRVIFTGTGHEHLVHHPMRMEGGHAESGAIHVRVVLRREGEAPVLRLEAWGPAGLPHLECAGQHLDRDGSWNGWGDASRQAMTERIAALLELVAEPDHLYVQLRDHTPRTDPATGLDVLRIWAALRHAGVSRIGLGAWRMRYRHRPNVVQPALHWLAAHAAPDGRWAAGAASRYCDGERVTLYLTDAADPAWDDVATCVSLLAFLGAGHHGRGRNPLAVTVRRSLEHLRERQDSDGAFTSPRAPHAAETHALATLAAMHGGTGHGERPAGRPDARAALAYLPRAWRSGRAEPRVTAWAVTAVANADAENERARRIGNEEPYVIDPAFREALHAEAAALGDAGGETEDAIELYVRCLLGESPRRNEDLEALAARVAARPPRWSSDAAGGDEDPWRWFFATYGLYHVGGSTWSTWARALRRTLRQRQLPLGSFCCYRGSWDPIDPAGASRGRVLTTAILALTASHQSHWRQLYHGP